MLVSATVALKTGDPKDEDTFIGPLISEKEAIRLEDWINSAIKRGAALLCGGKREGAMLEATLLENVPEDENICRKEAFGPVAVISGFKNFNEVLKRVNDSIFGLQAGIFTRDIYKAYAAWDKLDVGE